MDGTARNNPGRDRAAAGESAASLVESALQVRWRAPELALLLADRAAATGDGAAELLAAASLNRLGRDVEAGQRALAALRRAGTGAGERDLQQQLRVELAAGAVAVGAVGAALAVLRPVLEAGSGPAPDVRAKALVQLAAVLTALNRPDATVAALREADDLYQGAGLEPVPEALLRGMARALRSSHHRRHGELEAAESAARGGLDLLSELSAVHDGGAIGGRLVLELVLAQLDRGEVEAAAHTAASIVGGSMRAAAAPSRGWLHLALATRAYLPAGRHQEALDLLGDAIDAAERHMLDPVLAECLGGLCRIHEERGEHAEALHCLRSAHAAGYRHRRVSDALRMELVEEFGTFRRDAVRLADQLAGLVRAYPARRHGSEPPASLLDMPGFVARVEVVLAGAHPGRALSMAVIEVDLRHPADASGSPDPDAVAAWTVGQLRAMLPARGVVGRLDSAKFAVLLPGVGRAAALDWARRLRATVAEAGRPQLPDGLAVTVSAGVAEYQSGSSAGELLSAADRSLAAARRQGAEGVAPELPDHAELSDHAELPDHAESPDHAAVVDQPPMEAAGSAPHYLEPVAISGRARHRRDGGQQLPVAELLSAAGLDSGGSRGRRRSEDRSHQAADAADAGAPHAANAGPHAGAAAPPADPAGPPAGPAAEHRSGSSAPPTLNTEPPLGSLELVDDPAAGGGEWAAGTDRIGPDGGRENGDRDIGLGDLLAEALAAFEEGRTGGGGAGPVTGTPTEPSGATGDDPKPLLSSLGNEQVWRRPERRRRSAAGD